MVNLSAHYSVAKPGSLPVRIAGYQRRKMFQAFLATGVTASDTILDIGASSDRTYDHSNYLESWYAHKATITALGIDAGAAFLEKVYPGVKFVHGDGRDLPFADGAFDYVHSSAVLEHVGSRDRQRAFIAQAVRVARKCVFLTTPNRWFPVEFHTVLPLVHWLPKPAFRRAVAALGNDFLAREENLNLLSAGDLESLCAELSLQGQARVTGARLLGIVSNLILIVKKA
jgi:hypothetical protein